MELLISVLLLTTNVMAEDSVLSHVFFEGYQNCSKNKKMVYLSKVQRKELSKITNAKSIPGVLKTYEISCGKKITKIFLLSTLVRTHYQKGFVAVEGDKIKNIEIVHFGEPNKYKSPKGFLGKFLGKGDFKDIDGLTGATLTRSSLIKMSKLALELDKI